MKVIDFEKKGNVVRLYLGQYTEEYGWTNPDYRDHYYTDENPPKPHKKYYGDDWNDSPYDCNAGQVYEEFIYGIADIALPYGCTVEEPCNDWRVLNCEWCKDDMRDRKVPCLIVVYPQFWDSEENDHIIGENEFNTYLKSNSPYIKRIYFGDEIDDVVASLPNVVKLEVMD